MLRNVSSTLHISLCVFKGVCFPTKALLSLMWPYAFLCRWSSWWWICSSDSHGRGETAGEQVPSGRGGQAKVAAATLLSQWWCPGKLGWSLPSPHGSCNLHMPATWRIGAANWGCKIVAQVLTVHICKISAVLQMLPEKKACYPHVTYKTESWPLLIFYFMSTSIAKENEKVFLLWWSRKRQGDPGLVAWGNFSNVDLVFLF